MKSDQYIQEVVALWRDQQADPLELWEPLPETQRLQELAKWGVDLPNWLLELWANCDGQGEAPPLFVRPGFLTGCEFLAIDQALELQNRLAQISGNFVGWVEEPTRDSRIKPGWFPDTWVPFASFGGSSIVLFADLDPGPRGVYGQVIAFVHDPDRVSLVSEDGPSFLAQSLLWYRENVEEFVLDFVE